MHATLIRSHCEKPHMQQDICCLRIKKMTICVEQSYSHVRTHLLYDCDSYEQELQKMGHQVSIDQFTLPVSEHEFNELALTMHHAGDHAVFLFSALAIKCSLDVSIDYFCKENLSLQEAAAHWGIEVTDSFLEPMVYLHVPNDTYGKYAIALEQLQYQYWDIVERAPGEILCMEERLCGLVDFYRCLAAKDQESLDTAFHNAREDTQEFLEWNQELLRTPGQAEHLYEYYANNLRDGQEYLTKLNALQKEIQSTFFENPDEALSPGVCDFSAINILPLCKPKPSSNESAEPIFELPF